MALLGKIVLTVGVTEIIKHLLPVIEDIITSVTWGFKGDLKKLKQTLESIQAAVSVAETNQLKHDADRLWLGRLKYVLYDADDVMDQYSYEITRRDEMGSQLQHNVRDFVSYSSSNRLLFRSRIAWKIRAINNKLDGIHEQNKRYNVQNTPPGVNVDQATKENNLQTSSTVGDDSVLLGREVAKSEIIRMMLNSRPSPSIASSSGYSSQQAKPYVVSIVGMGGLGKTTLAQLIYKDSNLRNFESRAWVCVSDNFHISNILIKMIESIDKGIKYGGSSDLEAVGNQVTQKLNDKNFLLVLDDLWNEDSGDWEKLMNCLVCARSIKILITTRSGKVASVAGGKIHQLQRLSNDVCWSIMKNIISSRDERVLTDETKADIGKDIAERCDGLPLAAKFLGNLMASNTEESYWLEIKHDNNLWNNEGNKKLLSIIKLSYDKLPSPSKQCFSYCSVFPKDWEFEKETLIRLWMAEGFLQSSNVSHHKSIEVIGNEYFELMLSNSFFQDIEKDDDGVIMTCKMHDIVHDLAMTVLDSNECGFFQSRDMKGDTSKVRRLQMVFGEGSSAKIPEALSKAKRLRTVVALAPKNCSQINSFFSIKRLRVLYPLGDWGKQICTSIPKLKHLRYLDLSGCTIDSMHEVSLNRCYNLLTLVLRRCVNVSVLLCKTKSLKSLRHLDLSRSDIESLPDSIVDLTNLRTLNLHGCAKLEALPDNFGLLVHLNFLDLLHTAITKLPDSIGQISNLRNMKFPWRLNALPTEFEALTQFKRLDLEETNIQELPESLSRSRCKLETMKMGRNCKLPKDIQNWRELKHLTHHGERRSGDIMPTGIQMIPYLKTLDSYMVRKEATSNGHSGIEELAALNDLEELHIARLENVRGGKEDAERAKLKDKQHLNELYLNWSSGSVNNDNASVLEGLQPHSNLSKLVIDGFMGSELPMWIACSVPANCLLQNLVELWLWNIEIDVELPALGMLPRLRILLIVGPSVKNLGVCCCDGEIENVQEEESISRKGKEKEGSSISTQPLFLSLMELTISSMEYLEDLIAHSAPDCATCKSFPYLEVLNIEKCERLRSIPSLLSYLNCLELRYTNYRVTGLFLTGYLESLTRINIEYAKIRYLPPLRVILQNSPELEYLEIMGCKKFRGFRKDDDLNSLCSTLSLRSLKLHECPILKFLPDLRSWTSLEKLEIWKCGKLKESLPYDLKSLSFLESLEVDFIESEQHGTEPAESWNLVNLMELDVSSSLT